LTVGIKQTMYSRQDFS